MTQRDLGSASVLPTRDLTKEFAMQLIHEELARSHLRERHREAEREGRAARIVAARRWQRRAEAAARRARLAAAAVR